MNCLFTARLVYFANKLCLAYFQLNGKRVRHDTLQPFATACFLGRRLLAIRVGVVSLEKIIQISRIEALTL